jgi:3-hydroxyisobutyrate dehydrogenase
MRRHVPIVSEVVGFIGLGVMGEPMARNLASAGTRLVAWNRTPAKAEALRASGAEIAADAATVLARVEVTILMLSDGEAIDTVLGRGTPLFVSRVSGRTIVSMGTAAPDYSERLEADIRAAGGHYVEAPVSGSRIAAEAGQLVAMAAGEAAAIDRVRPLLEAMCRAVTVCGPVPKALLMKLSVNTYLISLVTGLAEAVQFARLHNLDLDQLVEVLDAGPMASDVMRRKAPKLVAEDFAVEASIADVRKNTQLIVAAAAAAGIAAPLIEACQSLYAETVQLGFAGADMAAVVMALGARSGNLRLDAVVAVK